MTLTPQSVHRYVCAWEERTRAQFWKLGEAADFMQETQGWKQVSDADGKPFRSFDHWLSRAMPHSYKRGYSAKTLFRALRALPMEVIEAVPQESLSVLALLSSPELTDEVIAEAVSKPAHEFRKVIQAAHPNLHISTPVAFKVMLDSDAMAVVDDKVKASGLSRADAVEAAFAAWEPE